MTQPAIRVENLSKVYRIGANQNGGYRTLRESIGDALRAPYRRLRGLAKREPQPTHWALRNVSFEVQPGDVVGIVGRNGAGKSTLLKTLSRITEPTSGRLELRGRIGSLLEVGTGFHPELTGRENIFFNGAILGMKRAEIRRRFDEIVDFAEVGEFLDTPVKRYSSGMYVRLAFAVAAHLDTDILIVDEVLAVGDVAFQSKCLGKLQSVSSSGRTVLFVSHHLASIQRLCTRGIFLHDGECRFQGSVDGAIATYLATLQKAHDKNNLASITNRSGSQRAQFTGIAFQNDNGEDVETVPMGAPMRIALRFQCRERIAGLAAGIVVADSFGQRLFRIQSSESLANDLPSCLEGGEIVCRLPRVPIVPGLYTVSLGLATWSGEQLDLLPSVASFSVIEADVFGTGKFPDRKSGLFLVDSQWTHDYR